MKVKDLIAQDIDVDVLDNVCEELYIAFCGKVTLTKEGAEYFAEVLEYDVELKRCGDGIIAVVDIDGEDWERKLYRAKEFFHSLAGYCDNDDYEKWFKEEE